MIYKSYEESLKNLSSIPVGVFRYADLYKNLPAPAILGLIFRNDVVKNKRFPDVTCKGYDSRSTLYEKHEKQ